MSCSFGPSPAYAFGWAVKIRTPGSRIIGKPKIMHACTKYGLRVNKLLPLVYKGLSGCYDAKGGDGVDRLIAALARVTPTPR